MDFLAQTSNEGGSAIGIAFLVAYFIPTIVAFARKVPNTVSIAVVNVFLGWTMVGWVVALAMAVRTKPPVVTAHAGTTPARPDGEHWPTSYGKKR